MKHPIKTLVVLLSAQGAVLPAADLVGTARRPNIVIILTDDQGYADLDKYGAEGFQTPQIDCMAEDGAVFHTFHVAQQVCSASCCALSTGCYPMPPPSK